MMTSISSTMPSQVATSARYDTTHVLQKWSSMLRGADPQRLLASMLGHRLLLAGGILFLSLLPSRSIAGSFDFKIGSGISYTFTLDDKMCENTFEIPTTFGIGYSFSRLRISIEGFWGWPIFYENLQASASVYGSLVGEYFFFSEEHYNGYALVGIGYGWTFFDSCEYVEPDPDLSGPVMLQTGVGVTFKMLEWLDLAMDIRFRMGVPENPDVVAIIQHSWVVFKL